MKKMFPLHVDCNYVEFAVIPSGVFAKANWNRHPNKVLIILEPFGDELFEMVQI